MVFDKEDIKLIRSLTKAVNNGKHVFLDTDDNIEQISKRGDIIVSGFISQAEATGIIKGYNYVVKIQNLLLCFEYDGYTLYAIKN